MLVIVGLINSTDVGRSAKTKIEQGKILIKLLLIFFDIKYLITY